MIRLGVGREHCGRESQTTREMMYLGPPGISFLPRPACWLPSRLLTLVCRSVRSFARDMRAALGVMTASLNDGDFMFVSRVPLLRSGSTTIQGCALPTPFRNPSARRLVPKPGSSRSRRQSRCNLPTSLLRLCLVVELVAPRHKRDARYLMPAGW